MKEFELKLPEDVLENVPTGKDEMLKYLAKYFDSIIDKYDTRFQQRVMGAMGGPLSRYEKSILKDFLIDAALGHIEAAQQTAP